MVGRMIAKLADYIVSPLGMGTRANYEAVKAGQTRLRRYEGLWGLPEPFVASLMDDALLATACQTEGIDILRYTRFERLVILAAVCALRDTDIRPESEEVLFVLATTKGNVDLLDERQGSSWPSGHLGLTEAARQVAGWFRNPNEPLVVCNACISGMDAQLEAMRALESGRCRQAVVIGADVLSPFIVSGFQSLKALSAEPCRPFDEDRIGLNLGEAAACVVYGLVDEASEVASRCWSVVDAAVRNDAYHVSSPSKTAEGACCALRSVLAEKDLSGLAFVNVHGTATLFNDEMEAVALDRMGLSDLPANGLKGYFGHTLGAAGVLETLISMEALDDGMVLATKGFEHPGVSRRINISAAHRPVTGSAFLKMMAGFGGCNAALLFCKGGTIPVVPSVRTSEVGPERAAHTVHLTEREAVLDGRSLPVEGQGQALLKSLYHTYVGDYPKFYKMDPLCKLGFLASELLLQAEVAVEGFPRFQSREDRAVVMVGRSASICADRAYQQTIRSADDFYPSPSAFIYTLPNIVAGEIAMRNHYHGETTYLLRETPADVHSLLSQALRAPGTHSVLGGWLDVADPDRFEATLYIINQAN